MVTRSCAPSMRATTHHADEGSTVPAREAGSTSEPPGVDLYWIPLGAGGAAAVRVSGRIYESMQARRARRLPLDLYHTALEVRLPEGRFTVENAWPSPDADLASRGVVVEGPVWSPSLARFRVFRYEVRCWRDGVIPDLAQAVSSPQVVSHDRERARRLLDLTASVPAMTWGRDVLGIGEMWNSNSVISYLLASAGFFVDECRPPAGGRAPGWRTGILMARHPQLM